MKYSVLAAILCLFPSLAHAQQDLSKITAQSSVIVNYTDDTDGISIQSENYCMGRIQVKTTKGRVSLETYKTHIERVLPTILAQCQAIGEAQAQLYNQAYQEPENFDLTFSFTEDPLGYSCMSTSAAYPCFFHLKRKTGLQIELSSQLVKETEVAAITEKRDVDQAAARTARLKREALERRKIRHFDDAIYFLQRGEFEVFRNKRLFMSYFHNDFLKAYSNMCKSHISSPEIRTLKNIETTTIGGFEVNSEQVGQTETVHMEPRFAAQFDAKHKSRNAYLLSKFGLDTRQFVSYAMQNRDMSNTFIREKTCASEPTKAVLENLYRFSNNLPAQTGLEIEP